MVKPSKFTKVNILVVIITLFVFGCEYRTKTGKEDVNLSYSDQNIDIRIKLNEVKKMDYKRWDEGRKYNYFYYGTMISQLHSENEPKQFRLLYDGDEESEIYLDTIASIGDFWSREWWDEDGYRKNKIYVVFRSGNVDWDRVKFISGDSKYFLHKKLFGDKDK